MKYNAYKFYTFSYNTGVSSAYENFVMREKRWVKIINNILREKNFFLFVTIITYYYNPYYDYNISNNNYSRYNYSYLIESFFIW